MHYFKTLVSQTMDGKTAVKKKFIHIQLVTKLALFNGALLEKLWI